MKHCMTRPGQLDVHVLLHPVHVASLVNAHNLWAIKQNKWHNSGNTVINVINNKVICKR